MADERLHGGVEPVLLAQLDGETFGEIAGANAARIKPLNETQNGFHPFAWRMKTISYLIQGTSKIAIFVDRIDQDLPDQPAGGVGCGECQLGFQMVLETDLLCDIGFEICCLSVSAPA
jgi:hypothetical protein